MTLAAETAMVRLRRLYRDANHCDASTNQLVLRWALAPEIWAEHQIRYRNWGFLVTEATVRQCRSLTARIASAAAAQNLSIQDLVNTFPAPSVDELAAQSDDEEPA
jgi:hypothetical protein